LFCELYNIHVVIAITHTCHYRVHKFAITLFCKLHNTRPAIAGITTCHYHVHKMAVSPFCKLHNIHLVIAVTTTYHYRVQKLFCKLYNIHLCNNHMPLSRPDMCHHFVLQTTQDTSIYRCSNHLSCHVRALLRIFYT